MKVLSNGIEYYAQIKQNKPTLPYLLMLHGFLGSGRVFQPLISRLTDFCNPVTLDLAGHGRSTGTDRPDRYRTEEQLSDLKSIISRFQLSPLVLYGYSMGGRLALQFAIQYQQYISGLILESSTFGISGNSERRYRAVTDQKRAEAIEQNFSDFLKKWQKQSLFGNESGTEDHKMLYQKIMQAQKPSNLAACLRGFGSGVMPSVYDKLGTLKMPVLLIAGEMDEKFVSIHEQLAGELPDAKSRVISKAAHRVHQDQPELLLKEIQQFIKELRL